MVTIIGGSGFIGTKLCALLKSRGAEFNIVDMRSSITFPEFSFIRDIRSPAFSEGVKLYNALINLAAEHKDDVSPKSLYYETNVEGARNVCEVASKNDIKKIIFTSSVAVYGFAPIGTGENGVINPFNDYGKSKWEAEKVYRDWQLKEPSKRTLVIVRPTVVFGERNRGNVFNLLRQIAVGKFIMIGNGRNRKSMAYVENVAAFLDHSLGFDPGVHVFNYIDKPDFTMNKLVSHVNGLLGRSTAIKARIPYTLGLVIGFSFDLISKVFGKKFPISSIRVRKFCANSVYESSISSTGFLPPVTLMDAIQRTVIFEFVEEHRGEQVFYSE